MRTRTIAFCAMIVLLVARASEAGEAQHVYLVHVPGTRNHAPLIQTGFRLAGTKGIITALHGVVDGRRFSASNNEGRVLRDLVLVAVEIERDLALLSSSELRLEGTEGMALSKRPPTARELVEVWGHPGGMRELFVRSDVRIGSPAVAALKGLVLPEFSLDFEKRKSPSGDVDVLRLEASLVAGESGAPVLNSAKEVVAVVNGGLLGGVAGISWAIPAPFEWRPAESVRRRLAELAGQDVEELFRVQYAPPSRLRADLGATMFGSLESRQSASLGHRQALGITGMVALPVGRSVELGAEISWPTRDAFDSQADEAAAERLFLRDAFISFVTGRRIQLTRRLLVVPSGGPGIAALQARRLIYSRAESAVGTVVQTVSTVKNRVTPIVTAGIEMRVGVVGSVQLVGTYRMHLLFDEADDLAVRPRLQQRAAVGVRFVLQGTRR